jgi:hypothetical protein
MQQSAWPSALMWDPAAAARLGELHRVLARLNGVSAVLLVTGPDARASGWAGSAAIGLADRVATTRSCVLLDLTFDGGELHEHLQVDSVEGVADIFLYGASLKHVACRFAGHQFEFAPAGLPADSELILTHRRWHRLLGEVQASGAQLLAYVPAEAPGLLEFARRIPRMVVLATQEEVDAIANRFGDEVECLAVLSPAPTAGELDLGAGDRASFEAPGTPYQPAFPAVDEEPAETAPDAGAVRARRTSDEDFESIRVPREGAREALIADMRARQRAALRAPAPSVRPDDAGAPATARPSDVPDGRSRAQPAPHLGEPSFAVEPPRVSKRSWRGLYIALLVTVLAGLAVAAWYAYNLYLRPLPPTEPVATTAAVAPAAPVRSRIVPLPYSVAVEAHQELALANERVAALRDEEPDLGFYIAPVLVDSVLYFRVMAGPVADSVEASVLLRRLLEKGHKTGSTQWDVRQAPLAFTLGEYATRAEAAERERELAERSIPAYVIEVQALDGGARHRVYAGAYSGIAEAEQMRQMLRTAGLPDSLVQRVGVRR